MNEIEGETKVQAHVPAQSVDIMPKNDPPLPPNTTRQQDMVVAGQRRINLIWEFTQAAVTILITAAAIYCAVYKITADVLNYAFIAVISTYYARTNHTKIGGVVANQEGR